MHATLRRVFGVANIAACRNERAVVREIELWREKTRRAFPTRSLEDAASSRKHKYHPASFTRISGFEREEEGGFPEERAKRKSAESRESRDALTVRRYNREAFTIDERERKLCATRARGVFGKYDFHFSL